MKLRRTVLIGLLAATAAVAGLAPADAGTQPGTGDSSAPIYVTLLFSRSEVTAADNCIQNDTGIARLDTQIAPWLATYGITGTGSLQTGVIDELLPHCAHRGSSMFISWSGAQALAAQGWSFVSHTATYPSHLDRLSATQSYAETCGSAQAIDAHGLPGGHGLIAYPGAQPVPTALQTNYGQQCFAWGRQYGLNGTTTSADDVAPYWQHTSAPNGGPCNLRTAACYTIPAVGSGRYAMPKRVLAKVAALQPGQWFTLQSYIEVTGTSPAYTTSPIKWDCSSADPTLHWSNDNERYCYQDWQAIVAGLRALPNVVFTDPETVGTAFGRTVR